VPNQSLTALLLVKPSVRFLGIYIWEELFQVLLRFPVKTRNLFVDIGVGPDLRPIEVQFLAPDQSRCNTALDDYLKELLKDH
jgi:hypothetical protein